MHLVSCALVVAELCFFFFFQAEDGIRDLTVTGVQTCALPILPSNRPLPEYVRFIGRQREVATLLRWLGEPGGTIVGVEGPGGSGKTALLHAVADACEAAGRCWQPVPATPVFDAFVWVACSDGSGIGTLLEAVARTLDYPGLLARTPEDRRQAVRDLLSPRSVPLLRDDVDRGDPGGLTFPADLPGRRPALAPRRRRRRRSVWRDVRRVGGRPDTPGARPARGPALAGGADPSSNVAGRWRRRGRSGAG